jgi:uncharacterized protein with HEPN domain
MSSDRNSARRIESRAQDILEAIGRIREFIAGMDETEYSQDRKTQSAVERELLTISEAWGKLQDLEVSSGIAEKSRLELRFPTVAWPQIRGIGNILRHEYGSVDWKTIWNTVAESDDLVKLDDALNEAFPDAGPR